jgi:hypothetical protein
MFRGISTPGTTCLDAHGSKRRSDAADAAKMQRVFVACVSTNQEVPSWLAEDPMGFCYEPGALSEEALQVFADKLRSMNRVVANTSSPPFEALMERARAAQAFRIHRSLNLGSEQVTSLEIIRALIDGALEIVEQMLVHRWGRRSYSVRLVLSYRISS